MTLVPGASFTRTWTWANDYGLGVRIERLGDGPIITPALSDSIGTNIQGPSLIAAPGWIAEPLGRYYLYFADHKGGHIRLAYADDLRGPWTVHEPGALQLADSCFLTEPPEATTEQLNELRDEYQELFGPDYASMEQVIDDAVTPHIASPDVHVDEYNEQVVMYFHGLDQLGVQSTRVAVASDGLNFHARRAVLGPSYFRVFEHGGWFYALVMPGVIRRSRSRFGPFECGPQLFERDMRHSAVMVRDSTLHVFWSRVGDCPESILHSQIDLTPEWMQWAESSPELVLRPEHAWEGSDLPIQASQRGAINTPVHQLRDPAVFVEGDRTFLLYSAAGESCIGMAQVFLDD